MAELKPVKNFRLKVPAEVISIEKQDFGRLTKMCRWGAASIIAYWNLGKWVDLFISSEWKGWATTWQDAAVVCAAAVIIAIPSLRRINVKIGDAEVELSPNDGGNPSSPATKPA